MTDLANSWRNTTESLILGFQTFFKHEIGYV